MKKYFALFLLLIVLGFALFPILNSSGFSENAPTINVYNWGEYISDGSDGNLNVNAEFTKRTGIKVNYTTFQSNEALFAKLLPKRFFLLNLPC